MKYLSNRLHNIYYYVYLSHLKIIKDFIVKSVKTNSKFKTNCMVDSLFRKVSINRSWHILCAFLLLSYTLSAQDVSVSGTVTDESNIPLAGVSVLIKGTTTGVTTDFDGLYTISAPADATLQFSYIGFVSQDVGINSQSAVNVTMVEDVAQLSEVVVVGYGTMERANVTGAITTVDVTEISKAPVPNIVESLRGQVSGLQVSRSSGRPGSSPTFKIRGNNSLGASKDDGDNLNSANQPIIVVDGVPLVNQSLSELNSDDIESINILKDAASASIYGSSGANGVILITTKSGKAGKAQVKVSSSTGFVQLAQTPDVMTGDQFVQYFLDIKRADNPDNQNPSLAGALDAVEFQNYLAGKETVWLDQVLRTGIQNTVGVTFSGGSDLGTFYLAGNYYTESGPIKASDYERYSIRFNGDINIKDWLKVGARVQLSKSKSDLRSSETNSTLNALVGTSPFGNLYDNEGNLTKFTTEDRFAINPLHQINESLRDNEVDRIYVNPFVQVKLAEGLTYNLNTFAEQRNEFDGTFRSSLYTDGALNVAEIKKVETTTYLLDNILSYKKNWGDHGLNASLIYGFQQYKYSRIENKTKDTAADELGYWGAGTAPAAQQLLEIGTDDWGKTYTAVRLGYNYSGRYSATFTLRRDSSSKFIDDNAVGYFPSASFAWNAHAENWWFGGEALNQLKFRFSYGELGNDRINSFSYRAGTSAKDISGGSTGLRQGDLAGNADIRWETSKQLNAGLDFGFLNNRITGSFEIYKTDTEDVLMFQVIPGALNNGFKYYPSNIGKTENKGIEVGLKFNVVETEDFSWTSSVNWATNKSTIISLNQTGANGEPLDDEANGWFIGQDFKEIYGFKYEGVYQTDETPDLTVFDEVPEPGDAKFADVNGDGNIDFDDRTFLGNPTPDWYGGFNNIFTYKDFELSVLLESVQGVDRVNGIYGDYNQTRGNTVYINYWTPNNPTNDYPSVGENKDLSGQFKNSIHVEDASFIALRNVSFAYSMPREWLDNTFLSSLKFSIRGNNLKYWTDYKNAYSPEQTGSSDYPITKNWSLGVNLTF